MSKGAILVLAFSAAVCALIALNTSRESSKQSLERSEANVPAEAQTLRPRTETSRHRENFLTPQVSEQADDLIAVELAREIQELVCGADAEKLDIVYTNLLPALVSRDALAATRLLETLDAELREEFLRQFVRTWTAQDHASALAWIEQLRDSTVRSSAIADACVVIAQSNPEEALRTAARNGLTDGPVIESVAQQWAAKDFSAAMEWAKALPVGDREKVFARLAYVQSERDPSSAARFVAEEMSAGPIQTEAAISVLHQWALRDLPGARRWIALFAEGELRDRAESELQGFLRHNPGGEAD
jgi:hypothetical protein